MDLSKSLFPICRLHDHIYEKFASHFYVITECDRVHGLKRLLEVM